MEEIEVDFFGLQSLELFVDDHLIGEISGDVACAADAGTPAKGGKGQVA